MEYIYELLISKIEDSAVGNDYYIELYRNIEKDILYLSLRILIPVLLVAILVKYICKRRCTIRYFVMFIWSYYFAIVLHLTIISRSTRENVWGEIFEGWGFQGRKDMIEAMVNGVMLLPIALLLYIGIGKIIFEEILFLDVMIATFGMSLAASLGIEIIQAKLGRGTFQISDIVYNILGGCIGGLIYYIIAKISERLERLLE